MQNNSKWLKFCLKSKQQKSVFLLHAQFLQDMLLIHCDPEQDKVVPDDEWMLKIKR